MKEAELTIAVNRYLDDQSDDYAIMIAGPWGCGKTFFIEHTLRGELDKRDWRIVRVSMFGITSSDEFYDRLLSSIFVAQDHDTASSNTENESAFSFKKAAQTKRNATKRVRGTAKDIGLSTAQTFLKKFNIQLSVASKSITELLLGEKVVLVLDDLERCLLDETQLLGLMDSIIESQHRKVILLTNEAELKKKIASSYDDANASRRYLAAKEKLIWHVYPFEPDMHSLSRKLFQDPIENLLGCGHDSDDDDAIDRCLNALLRSGENNIRVLKRAMAICDILEDSQYFSNKCSDSRRMETLQDVLALACKVVHDNINCREDETTTNDSDNKSFIECYIEASIREKLDILPFIEDSLLRGNISDKGAMQTQLTEYQRAYHPEGEAAQKANESIAKWQHRMFSNTEVPSIVKEISDSIIPPNEGGLSFDRYREALEALEGIQERLPDCNVDMQNVISKMKLSIASDPKKALNSVKHGDICWQTAGFPSSMKRIKAIDELREYICDKSISSSVSTAQELLNMSGSCPISEIISIIDGEHGLSRSSFVLTSLDPELIAKRLTECSNEEVHIAHRAVLSPKMDAMLHADKEASVRGWLILLANALDPSAASEIANQDILGYIQQIIMDKTGESQEK